MQSNKTETNRLEKFLSLLIQAIALSVVFCSSNVRYPMLYVILLLLIVNRKDLISCIKNGTKEQKH